MRSIKHSIVAWTPPHRNTRGVFLDGVEIGPLGRGHDWSRPYACTAGAAYACVRNMTKNEAEKYVLYLALKLIVVEKMDPNLVDEKFLELEEYRATWEYPKFIDPCGLLGIMEVDKIDPA